MIRYSPNHPVVWQLGDQVNVAGVEDGQSLFYVLANLVLEEPNKVAVAVLDGPDSILCVRSRDLPALLRAFVGAHYGPKRLVRKAIADPAKVADSTDDDYGF